MGQVALTIAQASFHFQPSSPEAPLSFHPVYAPFLTEAKPSASPADATYLVSPCVPQAWAQDEFTDLLWDSQNWRMGHTRDGSLLGEVRRVPHDSYVQSFKMAPDFSTGTIVARSRGLEPKYTLNYPEELLVLVNRLSHLQAGLVHSSSVLVDGKCYLFYGRSGAGKTTFGRLWRTAGFEMLCDERNVVRLIDDIPYGASTPWHGEDPLVIPGSAPLGGVFNLLQAPENKLQSLSYTEAVAQLYANTLSPFYINDGVNKVLEVYEKVLETVPSYNLYFTPDQRAIDLCLNEVIRCRAN